MNPVEAASPASLNFIEVDGRRIAYRYRRGRDSGSPTLVFLPGYASDMEGTKALALDAFADRHGLGMVRFDYSGTGSSGGDFEAGTLQLWLDDALAALDRLTEGPVVLVGSSMGGWIALHMALRRAHRVSGLVGIAAAPDFTDWGFDEPLRQMLREHGKLQDPNPDSGRPVITLDFWTSGQDLLLLGSDFEIRCPVRLLHGNADREVPLDVALRTVDRVRSADVQLTIIKDGGHRLSEPHEIEALLRTVAALVEPQL